MVTMIWRSFEVGMSLHTYIHYWDVLRMHFRLTWVLEVRDVDIELKGMVPWTYMRMHLSLHVASK